MIQVLLSLIIDTKVAISCWFFFKIYTGTLNFSFLCFIFTVFLWPLKEVCTC